MRLEGQVAIVTGAGGGIGKATALLLAQEGASVLVNDIGVREGADAEAVVREIRDGGGQAVASQTSAVWDGAPAIVDQALQAFGRVDILINNATAGSQGADIWDLPEAEWDKSLDVNLKGYTGLIRAVAPHLARQGSGAVINMSSGAGFGHPAMVAYASAKEGVIGLTRTVAQELGRFGVRCNAIRPLALGISSDDYTRRMAKWLKLLSLCAGTGKTSDDAGRATHQSHPTTKVAPMIVWLCTEAAKGVNGRTFHVRGDTIALLSEPAHEQRAEEQGGWTLAELDARAPTDLVRGLTNAYLFADHPDLQTFQA